MNLHLPFYDAAVLVLASGRIAYSLTQDEIFRPLRERVYLRSAPSSATDIDGNPWRMIQTWRNNKEERARGMSRWERDFDPSSGLRPVGILGDFVACFYCVSAWTSAGALGAYLLYPVETVSLLTVFALWAGANLYAKVLH